MQVWHFFEMLKAIASKPLGRLTRSHRPGAIALVPMKCRNVISGALCIGKSCHALTRVSGALLVKGTLLLSTCQIYEMWTWYLQFLTLVWFAKFKKSTSCERLTSIFNTSDLWHVDLIFRVPNFGLVCQVEDEDFYKICLRYGGHDRSVLFGLGVCRQICPHLVHLLPPSWSCSLYPITLIIF